MFLVRALYKSQNASDQSPTSTPANAKKQLVEVADDDNDLDGFTHVQVRPMTYAEVAQLADSPSSVSSSSSTTPPRGRIDLPASLLDDEADDLSNIGGAASIPVTLNEVTRQHRSSTAADDDLLYGDRAPPVPVSSKHRSGKTKRVSRRDLNNKHSRCATRRTIG